MNTNQNSIARLWQRWFGPPVFPEDDEDRTRVAGMLHLILLVILGATLVAFLLAAAGALPVSNRAFIGVSMLITAGAALALLAILRTGQVQLVAWTLLCFQWVSTVIQVIWSGGIQSPVIGAFIITLLLAGFLIGRRAVFLFGGLSVLSVLAAWQLESAGHLPAPIVFVSRRGQVFIILITMTMAAALLILTIRALDRALHRARAYTRELEQAMREKAQAETALQQSEQRYRGLLENIPAITYVLEMEKEPVGRTVYVSPQTEKVTGYPSAAFIEDPLLWTKLIHPEDHARVMAESDHADQTGGKFTSEYRIITPDGKVLWFHDESALVKNEQGRPLYRLGMWTNITELKQAEFARQQAEELYRRAIVSAGAVPYILRHEAQGLSYAFIGENILQVTGYSAAELTSGLWRSLIEEGMPRGQLAHLTFAEADRLTDEDHTILWECDFRIRTRSGETRWIADTSVKGYDDKDGTLISIGLYQDVTERKRIEEHIKQLNQELERRVQARTAQLEAANRELEAFSYSVSHDLRAPLRAITSFTRIVKDDFSAGMDPTGRNFLDKVLASGVRMNTLIDDLLSFSRTNRKALTKQTVDLRALAQTVIESLAPETAHRQIEWIIAELPPAEADPVLLQQVYANLIGNAVKYTNKRAQARIEIGCNSRAPAERSDSAVEAGSAAGGAGNIYYVRDNGAGFDMKYADKLFGVFQRLHREDEFEGTGIGLATVQRIITRHGGRIWAEAEPDKGATFYFTLTLGSINRLI